MKKIKLGVKARITITARKVDGTSRLLADFQNHITDYGLDCLGLADSKYLINGVAVGAGNAPELDGDTVLASFIAGTTANLNDAKTVNQYTTAPYTTTASFTYRFPIGAAAGNIAEVGFVGNANGTSVTSASKLFSRALVKDTEGNPVVVTVDADEYLDVAYALTLIIPSTDITGTFTMNIDGVDTSFAYTMRASSMSNPQGSSGSVWMLRLQNGYGFTPVGAGGYGLGYKGGYSNGAIRTVSTYPDGTSNSFTDSTADTYTPGSYTRNFTYSLALTAGNVSGGIMSMEICFGLCAFQIQLSPVVNKVSTKTFSFTAAISWTRA